MKKLCALLLMLLLLLCAAEAEPLFEPTQEGIYNYCPAGFVEDGVTHLYYCTNVDSRVVTDHIGYRSSTDGVHYSDEAIVLANGKTWDAWDATHVCDPDVVKGEFKLDGEVYNYLMVYLGCQTGNNQGNEIDVEINCGKTYIGFSDYGMYDYCTVDGRSMNAEIEEAPTVDENLSHDNQEAAD